jgi:uncharacterized protein YndB with AHSA1/START domain
MRERGGTRQRLQWSSRVSADVDAPVEAVWRVVSDPTRTGEWSHECHRLTWVGGASSAEPGARFRGANKVSWLRWVRTNEVMAVEPPRAITWRTIPTWRFVDSTVWRIGLEDLGGGRTRIVQTYEVVKCPAWWAWVVDRMVPPHRDRGAALQADLVRLGGVARAEAATIPPAAT